MPLDNDSIGETERAIDTYPSRERNPELKVIISTPNYLDVIYDMVVCSVKRFFSLHPSASACRWKGDHKVSGETSPDTEVWIRDHFPENTQHFPCVIIQVTNKTEKALGFNRNITLYQDEEYLEQDNVAEEIVTGGMVEGTISFIVEHLGSRTKMRRIVSILTHGLQTRTPAKRENNIVSLCRDLGLVMNEYQIDVSDEDTTAQIANDLIFSCTISVPFFYTWQDRDWYDYYYCLIEYEHSKYIVKKSRESGYYVKLFNEDDELIDVEDEELEEIVIERYIEGINSGTLSPVMIRTVKLTSELSE